jgi:heptosyltransferase III
VLPEPVIPGVAPWLRVRVRARHVLRYLRHRFRYLTGVALARLMGPRQLETTLLSEPIHSVLICRVNARMGNTLFLTPLIQRLRELLPQASIDLAIAYPQADELLAGLPGLRQIILIPHKGPRRIWRYLMVLRRLRACQYDLAIDPIRDSMSGRVAMSLCRARFKLGFASNVQWARLTHAVQPSPDMLHHAIEPVLLLSRALGVPYEARSVRIWLPLRADELVAGRQVIEQAIGRDCPQASTRAFCFFAHAAGLKSLGRDWWLAFWEAFLKLQPEAIPIECLPTYRQSPVDARFASFHVPSPRTLSAAISATRMFISADCGPMHLASATPVPTVALFRASTPVLYGPLKPNDLVIDAAISSPLVVARRCMHLWRRRSTETDP